ncbi:LysM domain - like 10 [Theobroma cacao]|nr:LysM domain - like 10 [Theobroma cacao]
MIYLLFLIWIVANSSLAQQYYDPSACPEDTRNPGSRYTCNSIQQPCETFLVYRANQHFQVQNLLNISALFQMNSDRLLDLNNITSASEVLKPGREVLVPINCRCSGEYFRARLSYIVPERTSIEEIACGIFEGLLKSLTLLQDNPSQENDVGIGVRLHVPLRCACPDNVTSANGVKYLVTYAILEGDEATALSKKFGISPEDILAANRLEPKSTIFPGTTVLVPLKSDPTINLNIPDSPPPTPVVALLACGLYVKVLKKWKGEKLQSFADRNSIPSFSTARSSPRSGQTGRSSPRSGQTGRSSTNSCLSPDLLAGIKFSMYNYGIEDIRRATKDFDEDSKIGEEVYKGLIDNADVMIKRMKFEDTRQWRAKLANIGSSTLAVSSSRRNDNIDTVNGWVAPEFPVHGSASEKVDIFAFGVVLLELISGREATDGNLFKESIGFLEGGASEGGCFEQLRSFIDPSLKDNYLLAEALCLAVLAKACIEDDPLLRPSMDDILKVLGRMVGVTHGGYVVISTPDGILDHEEAISRNVGGQVFEYEYSLIEESKIEQLLKLKLKLITFEAEKKYKQFMT